MVSSPSTYLHDAAVRAAPQDETCVWVHFNGGVPTIYRAKSQADLVQRNLGGVVRPTTCDQAYRAGVSKVDELLARHDSLRQRLAKANSYERGSIEREFRALDGDVRRHANDMAMTEIRKATRSSR
jgi:hypothetical protein